MTDEKNNIENDEFDEDLEDDLVGCFIGNYKVLSLLGSGAFGDVYLGKHPTIESQVAIKVLDPSLSQDPEMVRRFNDEARAVNIIKHPNIIKIFDFGQLPDGRHYFTMEFLEGKELTDIIKEKAPVSMKYMLRIAKQVCAALDAAHNLGVIHRDLKPDNIYIIEKKDQITVKILDFGIAKLRGAGDKMKSKRTTSVGMVMGTPLYMSPEQAAGANDEIGPQSDIYSFGIILFKMLSNTFPLNADSPRELLYKQVAEAPIKLGAVTKGLPEIVCNAIDKTLEKKFQDRFQTAGELYEELKSGAALVSPDLIAVINKLDEGENLDDELDAARKSLTPRDSIQLYNKPKEKSGTFTFILLMLLIIAAGGAGGFLIWKKAVSFLNKKKNPPPKEQIVSKPKPKQVIMKPVMRKKKLKTKFLITISSKIGKLKIDVIENGKLRYSKKTTPFKFYAKKNKRIIIKSYNKNKLYRKDSFKVDGDSDLIFSEEKSDENTSRKTKNRSSRKISLKRNKKTATTMKIGPRVMWK